jgi:hypothetical protein
VSRLDVREQAFWKRVQVGPSCWLWLSYCDLNGYGRFGHARRYAHRVAWELTQGPIPDGLQVCHHCDNPPCVRPDHLFLGTQGDNVRDCAAKGRLRFQGRRTWRPPRQRLTAEQAAEIRERRVCGESYLMLARAFGVSESNIGLIVRRQTWKG